MGQKGFSMLSAGGRRSRQGRSARDDQEDRALGVLPGWHRRGDRDEARGARVTPVASPPLGSWSSRSWCCSRCTISPMSRPSTSSATAYRAPVRVATDAVESGGIGIIVPISGNHVFPLVAHPVFVDFRCW